MRSFEILAHIGLTVIHTEDFAAQMNAILGIAGRHAQVSRTYIFIDSPDGLTTNNEFEWCNVGITPQLENLQNVPLTLIPSWYEILKQEGRVYSEDIDRLPKDLVAVLKPQGILSIVVYPLFIDGRMKGFLGFDECERHRHWEESDLNLLKTISGIVSSSYDRKLYRTSLERSERNLQTFFNTIEDIVIICDEQGKIIHSNRAVTEKLDYAPEALKGRHILELHPAEDRAEGVGILDDMVAGRTTHCPLRMVSRSGSTIPVDTRVRRGTWDGRDCIFGISKDLTREQEALLKFTKLFEHNPAPMAISRVDDHTFTDVNEAFLQKLGYDKHEVIGKTSADLELFLDPEQHAEMTRKLCESGQVKSVELEIRCRNGNVLTGLFSGELINAHGTRSLLSVMVDITEQKQLEKRLSRKRERLANIIEGTQLGTWEWNVQTGETVFNERWANIVGYTLKELAPVTIGTWSKLAHPDDLQQSQELLEKHFKGLSPYYETECRMKHRDGHWVWVHDRGKVIEWDVFGKPLMMFGTHADITERRMLLDQVKELAIRDPLTGVYNRRYIVERIETLLHEVKRGKNHFSLSMLDIDHFKQLNDLHGHLAGDFALKELTSRVGHLLRPYDLLGRYGGEEFLVVSMQTDKAQAQSLVTRLAEQVRDRPFCFGEVELSVTFSAGIADVQEISVEDLCVSKLLELADRRLYLAKQLGRDRSINS